MQYMNCFSGLSEYRSCYEGGVQHAIDEGKL